MIRKANLEDGDRLAALFWEQLRLQPSYISHGEMQMGIADDNGRLLENGFHKWMKYISEKITGNQSEVFLSEENGVLAGFIVLEIDSDGDVPFGVVCDLLVDPDQRGKGIGRSLLDCGIRWLRQQQIQDIYLESGIGNHAAHAYFEKVGFRPVSHIFKMEKT